MLTVPIETLDLDPGSPRLRGLYQGATQYELREAMRREVGLSDLTLSFTRIGLDNLQPICVVAVGERYRIVDGNRRVAALLDLNESLTNQRKWTVVAELPVRVLESEAEALRWQVTLHNDTQGGDWPYSGKVDLWLRMVEQDYATEDIARLFGVQEFIVTQGLMSHHAVRQASRVAGRDWLAGRTAYIRTVSRCLSDCYNVRRALGLDSDRRQNNPEPNPIDEEHEPALVNLMCNLFQLRGVDRKVAGSSTHAILNERRLEDLNRVYGNAAALDALNGGQATLDECLDMANNPDRYDTSRRACSNCRHWRPDRGTLGTGGVAVPTSARCEVMTQDEGSPVHIHTRYDYACDNYAPRLRP